jgi:FkbM family methyltransferase
MPPRELRRALRRRGRLYLWRLRTAWRSSVVLRYDGDLSLASPVNNVSTRRTFVHGYRDPEIFAWLGRFLRPDMVVVDVGANVGVYSLFAAKRAAAVHAFEANPGLAPFLRANQARNRLANLFVRMAAVGDTTGPVAFRLDARNLGQSHVLAPDEPGAGALTVPMIRLDDYVAAQGIARLDLVKLDVEGYELPALRGSTTALTASRDVVVLTEMSAPYMARYGLDIPALRAFMTRLGFRPYALMPGPRFSPFEDGRGIENAFWSRRPLR